MKISQENPPNRLLDLSVYSKRWIGAGQRFDQVAELLVLIHLQYDELRTMTMRANDRLDATLRRRSDSNQPAHLSVVRFCDKAGRG